MHQAYERKANRSSPVAPDGIIIPAIKCFFRHVHRQPLWLFDRDDNLSTRLSEEILLAILSIVAQHPYIDHDLEQLRSPEHYSDAARGLIMSRIASG